MDLQGRLSNPPYHFGRAAQALPRVLTRTQIGKNKPVSRQLQRRLKPLEVDELVIMYEAGSSLPLLAEAFGIHRETVLLHLARRGVERRMNLRKMTDDQVGNAAIQYVAGQPVEAICASFEVNPTTLRRELLRAGVELRKPGRPTTRIP